MPTTSNCIFCKIGSGEQKAKILHETDEVIAFLDINPLTNGHTVVIPKSHYERFSDLPSQKLAELFQVTQNLNGSIQGALGAQGSNIGLNDGKQAGQVIPHTHVHIIPRYKGDSGGSLHSVVNMETEENLDLIVQKIKTQLG